MSHYKKYFTFLVLLLSGCAITGGNAVIEDNGPVVVKPATKVVPKSAKKPAVKKTTVKSNKPTKSKRYYLVKKGDTLYSIAFSFSKNYKELAVWNKLDEKYSIHPGQLLVLNAPPSKVKTPHKTISNKNKRKHKVTITAKNKSNSGKNTSNSSKQKSYAQKKQKKEKKYFKKVSKHVKYWSWPVDGKVMDGFSSKQGGNKGIDIAGQYGSSIKAVASGKVVYSGSGLRGYGNLLIIKHNDAYLSAYAYNKEILVKEGHVVKAGDKIAKMGRAANGQSRLHFEVRRYGKPVDPLRYLR